MDLDLWCRVILNFAGRIRRPRAVGDLHHHESMTSRNALLGLDWLDRVWLFEGLLAEELAEPERQKVEQLRRSALRTAVRAQAGRLARRRFSGELVDYILYRARAAVDAAPPLYPRLPDPLTGRRDGFARRAGRVGGLDASAREAF